MSPSLVLFLALVGQPSDDVSRDDVVAQAVERFEAEDYEGAIEAFGRAYALEHQPMDLYNIGRVYEEMGRPERARRYYERFLAQPELTAEERAEGEQRLAALPEPQVAPAGAPVPEDRPRRRWGDRDRDESSHHWATVTGSVLLPAGVVTLVAGTAVAGTAMRNARNAQLSADEQTPYQQTPHYALARRQAITSDVLLATGGVLAASGITALVVGLTKDKRSERRAQEGRPQREVAIAPAGAGLRLNVRF